MSDRKLILFSIGASVASLCFVVTLSAAFVLATDVFLLGFLGILLSVFLTKLSTLLAGQLRISYGWSLGLVTLGLVVMMAGILFFIGHRIESQVRAASSHVDEAAASLRHWVKEHPMLETSLADLPFAGRLLSEQPLVFESSSNSEKPDGTEQPADSKNAGDDAPSTSPTPSTKDEDREKSSTASQGGFSDSRLGKAAQVIAGIFRTTFGAVMNIAIVVFVGMFLAIDPPLYRDGFSRLFPRDRRNRVREILNEMGSTLWSWLWGRLASMLLTGVGTGIGLAILGVPMPVALGTLTGLLTFIPNIGPAIGLAISVLVATPQGSTTVWLVVVVFLLFQLLESYVMTPLIQHRQVAIPPAVLITWQILLGVFAGFLGITVSTPLLAVGVVLIRMAYLEDVLGDTK